jgi:hypothetical protein
MELTQGSSAPAQPQRIVPRKRRRWLIVAFVLVLGLVSLVTWMHWPRVDQRLVGKWYHSNPVAVAPIEFTVNFQEDGSGTIWAVNHDPHLEADMITTPIRWWVNENELLLLRPAIGSPSALDRILSALGTPFSGKPSCLRIVRVTDRQIHWQRRTDDADSEPLVLDRVE